MVDTCQPRLAQEFLLRISDGMCAGNARERQHIRQTGNQMDSHSGSTAALLIPNRAPPVRVAAPASLGHGA
ncbi:hypothetical protein V2G26_008754 [Clonostachys chloroleuca]